MKKLKKQKGLAIRLADMYYPGKFFFWIILDLILLATIGFSQSLVKLIIIYAIPALIAVINVSQFTLWLVYWGFVKATNTKFVNEIGKDYVNTYKGPPGTGKSTINNYSSIVKAKYQYEQLQIEYAMLIPFEDEILESGDQDKIHHLNEVSEAFEFYAKNPNVIPLLTSNIPVLDFYNRFSTVLDVDHLEMRERLPYRGIGIYDEVGLTLMADNKRGDKKNARLATFMRFDRQFTEFTVGMTEQNSKNENITIRSVVAINRCMLGQKSFLKPKLLILIQHALCKMLIKKFKYINEDNFDKIKAKAKRVPKWYINYLLFFNKFLRAVGFRVFRYKDTENDELKVKVNSDDSTKFNVEEKVLAEGKFVIPAYSNCKTSDRPFKFAYECKDQKLKFDIWQSLIIEDYNILQTFKKNYK